MQTVVKRKGIARSNFIGPAKYFGLALSAAASLGLYGGNPGFAAAAPAPADSIVLSDDNIADYLQPKDGINWLGSAAEPEQRQNYQLADFVFLDTLGLKTANTVLTIDSRRNSSPVLPLLLVEDSLHIGNGRLNIIAAAAPATATEPNPEAPLFPAFPPLALGFAAEAGARTAFVQTGGLVSVRARDNAIAVSGGNFYAMRGGGLAVSTQDNAAGLQLLYSDPLTGRHNGADILFRQSGGLMAVTAADDSVGLRSNQSAAISGGSWHIYTSGQAHGVLLDDADTEFRQQGGLLAITAADNSAGLTAARLHISGGRLVLRSSGRARAIHITSGRREDGSRTAGVFLFEGGIIEMAGTAGTQDGHERAYAVYGDDDSRAVFGKGSVLRPVITADIAGQGAAGLISFGSLHIMPQARLDIAEIKVLNSYRLTANAALSLNFLESRETPINGRFTLIQAAPQEKLFYSYAIRPGDDGRHYQLRLEPKSSNSRAGGHSALRVSDIGRGNNRRAAKAVEQILLSADTGSQTAGYHKLEQLYSALYNSNSGEEKLITQRLRRLSPYQATRLPALSQTIEEEFAEDFRLPVTRLLAPGAAGNSKTAEQAGPATAKNSAGRRIIWLKPTGGQAQYRAQNSSFTHLNADYGGFNFGMAAPYGSFAFGAASSFITGRLHGGGDHAAMRHWLIGSSLAYAPPGKARGQPVSDIYFTYGYSRFRQDRHDSFAAASRAFINQHNFMTGAALKYYYPLPRFDLQFAPQLGLDYAYTRQNGFKEKGGFLPLRVESAGLQVLRPKIGAALLWHKTDRLAVTAGACYYYDLLGRAIDLDTQFRSAGAAAWRSKGEKMSRSSAGGKVEFTYYRRAAMALSGAYHVSARPYRIAQRFSAGVKFTF